uniref:Uncharacterized protein n=1 Tax=Trichobilharzia regenti TaxID=157069 RepID=A0AA85IQ63_TRIRE|nr:unnamed protein product [Trichobilharzia regenti]
MHDDKLCDNSKSYSFLNEYFIFFPPNSLKTLIIIDFVSFRKTTKCSNVESWGKYLTCIRRHNSRFCPQAKNIQFQNLFDVIP